jgi:hypothetical protein
MAGRSWSGSQPARRPSEQARRSGFTPNRGRGGPQAGRGGIARGGGRDQNRLIIARSRKVKEDEGGESKDDISLEILENGCDAKQPSRLISPESPLADLDDVFGRSFNASPSVIAPQGSAPITPLPGDRTQWIRETFGGDYSRFATHSPDLYIASPRTLNLLKHAQLVLSKKKDISIAARHRALDIVESSVVRST